MKLLSLRALALAAGFLPLAAWAFGPPQGAHKPSTPPNAVKTGKNGELYVPSQSVEGGYRGVTPPALVKEVSGVSECKVKVQEMGDGFSLSIVSSLPLRNLEVRDAQGATLAAQALDDEVDFSIPVHQALTETIKVLLDVNLGYDDGQQVIEQQSFDLQGLALESAKP